MEIRYIQEFVVLAKVENYHIASSQLYISQSSLSKHMQTLQKELGISLFHQNGRNIYLSDEGKRFLPDAKRIADAYSLSLEHIASDSLQPKPLKILTNYSIVSLLAEFRRLFPQYPLSLREATSTTVIEELGKQEYDLVILANYQYIDGFHSCPFGEDSLAAILPSTHPLKNRDKILLSELKNDNFVSFQQEESRNEMIHLCQQAGFRPKITMFGNRGQDIANYVRNGLGISFLYQKAIFHMHIEGICIIPMEPTSRYTITGFYPQDKVPSPAANALIHYLKNYFSLRDSSLEPTE